MSTIAQKARQIDRDQRQPLWADQNPGTRNWDCACCGQPARLYARGPRCDGCLKPAPAVMA